MAKKSLAKVTGDWLLRRAASIGLPVLPKPIHAYLFGTDGKDVAESTLNHKWDKVLRRYVPKYDEVVPGTWITCGRCNKTTPPTPPHRYQVGKDDEQTALNKEKAICDAMQERAALNRSSSNRSALSFTGGYTIGLFRPYLRLLALTRTCSRLLAVIHGYQTFICRRNAAI